MFAMWFLFSALVILIGESQAQLKNPFLNCNTNQCVIPTNAIKPDFLPTAEELNELCPSVLQYKNCYFNGIKECTGESISELTSSNNQSVALFSSILLAVEGMVVDLCDEDSSFHESYVQHVECLRGKLNKAALCGMASAAAYNNYKRVATQNIAATESEQQRCLGSAYSLACFTVHVKLSCGEEAKSFVQDILRRLPLMSSDCTGLVGSILKNEFLESLDLDAEPRSMFSEVFDMLAR